MSEVSEGTAAERFEAGLAQMDKILEPEVPEEETPPEPETPEPAAEEAEEPAVPEEPEPAAEKLYAGKYKTEEELERAYTELQSRLGEQGSELGELRKTLDTLNERLAKEPEPEPVRMDQGTIDWFDAQVEENPYGAAVWALQNDPSGTYYNRVMGAWFEQDPMAASEFRAQLTEARLRNEFDQRLAEKTTPLEEQASKAGLAQAWSEGRAQFLDLDSHSEQIVQAAQDNPELAERLVSGDPEDRQKALRILYFAAKGMQTATVEGETRTATEMERTAARAAKQDGTVATQTTTVSPEQVSEDEAWLQANFDPYAKKYMSNE